MGILSEMKDIVKDTGLTSELCDHVKNFGLDVKVIDTKDPDAVHHSTTMGLGSVPLGCIKIKGSELDVLEMYRMIDNTRRSGRLVYYYQFVSKFDVGEREKYFDVQVDYVKKGIVKQEVVDFHWVGGKFADVLNSDQDIRNRLLRLDVPKIIVHPNKKDGYIALSSGYGVYNMMVTISTPGRVPPAAGRYDFPSSHLFELYEQIMKKIKSDTNK